MVSSYTLHPGRMILQSHPRIFLISRPVKIMRLSGRPPPFPQYPITHDPILPAESASLDRRSALGDPSLNTLPPPRQICIPLPAPPPLMHRPVSGATAGRKITRLYGGRLRRRQYFSARAKREIPTRLTSERSRRGRLSEGGGRGGGG